MSEIILTAARRAFDLSFAVRNGFPSDLDGDLARGGVVFVLGLAAVRRRCYFCAYEKIDFTNIR